MSIPTKPGDIQISKITLISGDGERLLDIRGVFIELDIYEDIFENSMTAVMSITDSNDLIGKLPIIGEETVEVEFLTPGSSHVIAKTFRVYAIRDKVTDNSKSVYNIQLITKEAIDSINGKRSKAYTGFTHDIVASILGVNDMKIESTRVEDSLNKIKFVSNYWTPFKCINYCASKSFDKKSMSPNFLFFESNKQYNFVSANSLFDPSFNEHYLEDRKRRYSWDASTGREEVGNSLGSKIDPDTLLTQVIDLKINRQFDYLRNLITGAYSNRVIEHDVMRKSLKDITYNYWYDFEKNNHLGELPIHSEFVDFNDTNLNVSAKPIFTHIHGGITTDKSATIAASRVPLMSQLDFISFDITVRGRTDIQAGDLIWLDIKSAESIIDEYGNGAPNKDYNDKLLSGRYLISAIQHRIASCEHQMIMRVTKDSFK